MTPEKIIQLRWALSWEARFIQLRHDQLAEVCESLFMDMQTLIRECTRLREQLGEGRAA